MGRTGIQAGLGPRVVFIRMRKSQERADWMRGKHPSSIWPCWLGRPVQPSMDGSQVAGVQGHGPGSAVSTEVGVKVDTLDKVTLKGREEENSKGG